MSVDLQIALLALGAAAVFMVYMVTKWQRRRSGKDSALRNQTAQQPQNVAGGSARDELFARTRPPQPQHPPEPEETYADDSEYGEAPLLQPLGGTEPPASAPAPQPETETATTAPAQPTPNPEAAPDTHDPVGGFRSRQIPGFGRLSQIDYWIKIVGERDVGRESVLALYRDGAAEFGDGCAIHGIRTDQRVWRNVEEEAEESRFADLVMSIQLADCNGAISALELEKFSALALRLAEGTGRELAPMTNTENALAQAKLIAEFAQHFNYTFAVKIIPQDNRPFQGTAIERYALQNGLRKHQNKYFSHIQNLGKREITLYSLADLSHPNAGFDFDFIASFSTYELTFFTRPLLTKSSVQAVDKMLETAKIFAERIKGKILFPNDAPFVESEVLAIQKSIQEMAEVMESFGIAAGSEEICRLFPRA